VLVEMICEFEKVKRVPIKKRRNPICVRRAARFLGLAVLKNRFTMDEIRANRIKNKNRIKLRRDTIPEVMKGITAPMDKTNGIAIFL